MTPEQHAEASRRWRAGEAAWDIAEALHIPLRSLLAWTASHPDDFPALAMSEEPEAAAPRRRRRSLRQWAADITVLLPATPSRPKPASADALMGTIDLGCIADALQVETSDAEAAIRILVDGGLQQDVMELLNRPYGVVRQLCRHLGWSTAWHKPGCVSGDRVGRLDRATVVAMFEADETLEAIGQAAGVTREYIRLICLAEGLRPRQQIAAERRAERQHEDSLRVEQERAAKAADRERRKRMQLENLALWLDAAREMWDAGATMRQIAIAYNLTANSLGWYMHAARQRLGPAWFPLREPQQTPEEVRAAIMAQSEDLRRRWAGGEQLPAIAQAYGWTIKRLQGFIRQVRDACGDEALPRRSLSIGANSPGRIAAMKREAQQRLHADAARIAPLWAQDLTAAVIAAQIGLTAARVSQVVTRMRQTGHEQMFPLRHARPTVVEDIRTPA